jgi:hypothetical protein
MYKICGNITQRRSRKKRGKIWGTSRSDKRNKMKVDYCIDVSPVVAYSERVQERVSFFYYYYFSFSFSFHIRKETEKQKHFGWLTRRFHCSSSCCCCLSATLDRISGRLHPVYYIFFLSSAAAVLPVCGYVFILFFFYLFQTPFSIPSSLRKNKRK